MISSTILHNKFFINTLTHCIRSKYVPIHHVVPITYLKSVSVFVRKTLTLYNKKKNTDAFQICYLKRHDELEHIWNTHTYIV